MSPLTTYGAPILVATSGAGEIVTLPFSFAIDLTFDETTDLTGVVFPGVTGSPRVVPVLGFVSDFVSPVAGLSLPIVMQYGLSYPTHDPRVTPLVPDGTFTFELTYTFTPLAAAPAPEPSGLILLLPGVVALWSERRRDRRT